MATSNVETLQYRKTKNFKDGVDYRVVLYFFFLQSSNKRRILLIGCGVYLRAALVGNFASILQCLIEYIRPESDPCADGSKSKRVKKSSLSSPDLFLPQ